MDTMKDKVMTYLDVYNSNCINPTNNVNPVNISNHVNTISNSNHITAQLNETEVPTNTDEVIIDSSNSSDPKQPIKKGRKVKSNKSQWRKEKGNKYLNKPYRNYKGVEIKSKEFIDYDCKCQMKCRDILSAAERKQEFQKFWELGSYEAQAIFLIARVDEQVTKKSTKKKKDKKDENQESEKVDTPDGKKSKRQFSRTYILKSKQVCRNMFVKTLGITSKRINTALVKMRSKSLIDHRGLSQGGKNKISDKRYDEVVDHIKKMPRYKCSHLQGKFDSEFLPPELSLSKMYDLYSKEVDQPVSLSMYKKIYYGKFNFKTKGIKKEICNICKGERKIKNENLKKQQQNREKHQYPCPSPPNDQVVLQHHQYRPTNNFMPPPPINCNQSWLPPPNFQMPQHNPTHYFEQPMGYE
ncbi:DUF3824 domain-containing protein [Trichonephila inaurata madagascariensis]|uniref:DUF3824 domain-containing protein n=1 Tax=Trichonephila inaurata madagascariensis TaxID=2747483 RepID=A0A8X6X9S0_9ARAC|nr:DUF3824 domain-containing protein [Trichonephila inaurata madagascariensis]